MGEDKYWQELRTTHIWIFINRNIKFDDFFNDWTSWDTHCPRPTRWRRMKWRNFLRMPPIYLKERIDYRKVIILV